MATIEPNTPEDRLIQRYRFLAKLLLLFSLIYSFGIAILIMGTYFLDWGNKPAGFTIEQWVLSCIVLVTVFIVLEVLALVYYALIQRKQKKAEQPEPVFTEGKQVTTYTIPVGAKGGLFSKTYIQMDQNNVLNLRYQIVPPNELWEKKI